MNNSEELIIVIDEGPNQTVPVNNTDTTSSYINEHGVELPISISAKDSVHYRPVDKSMGEDRYLNDLKRVSLVDCEEELSRFPVVAHNNGLTGGQQAVPATADKVIAKDPKDGVVKLINNQADINTILGKNILHTQQTAESAPLFGITGPMSTQKFDEDDFDFGD